MRSIHSAHAGNHHHQRFLDHHSDFDKSSLIQVPLIKDLFPLKLVVMENRKLLLILLAVMVSANGKAEQTQDGQKKDENEKIRFSSTAGNGEQQQKPVRQAPIHDAKHIHDKEHIKEHLQEVTDVKEDDLSDGNLQFHYFKLHDYDNNDKLDGIELANAMTHYHDEETGEKAEDYSEDELGSMVDQILEEDDTNRDGYIDYPEFIASQNRE